MHYGILINMPYFSTFYSYLWFNVDNATHPHIRNSDRPLRNHNKYLFSNQKRREDTDEDARFKEAEEIIKRSSAWANTSSGSDTDSDVQKSKSCTIL